MTFEAVLAILGWVLPLAKAAASSLSKSGVAQNVIDDIEAAAAAIEKVVNIDEPTRAEVLDLDIDPAAWGPPKP